MEDSGSSSSFITATQETIALLDEDPDPGSANDQVAIVERT